MSRQKVFIANSDQLARLKAFESELKDLCDKHGIDLSASSMSDILIEIRCRDDARPKAIRTDWPSFACFEGVDEKGVYHRAFAKGRLVAGLDVLDYDIDEESAPELTAAGILTPGFRLIPLKSKKAGRRP